MNPSGYTSTFFSRRCPKCARSLAGIGDELGRGACPDCGTPFDKATLGVVFKPECPKCRYDLAGIADPFGRGVCPECGSRFDTAELRAQWGTRRSWIPKIHPLWYLACSIVLAVVCPPLHDDSYGYPWGIMAFEFYALGIMWLLFFTWQFLDRHRVFGPTPRCWLILLAALPVARTALGIPIGGRDHLWAAVGILFICFILCALLSIRSSKRLSLAVVAAGVFVAVPGCLMLLTLLVSTAGHWSRWPDPRPGQSHYQYPLTVLEAASLGSILAVVGAACMIVGATFVIRRANQLNPPAHATKTVSAPRHTS